MAELFGVARTQELTPPDAQGFERMAQRLYAFRRGGLRTGQLPWCRVGILSQHAGDRTAFAEDPRCPLRHAWIGASAREASEGSFASHDAFQALDPPTAGCLLDGQERSVQLVSDRFGHHPVYYALSRGLLVFSTKLAPILSSGLLEWSLCPEAVLDFFSFEHVTGDRTFAREVRLLAPASVLHFERGEGTVRSYLGDPAPAPVETRSARDVARILAEELTASVTECSQGASSIALPLSGGLDSRAILGAAVRTTRPVRTYTFGPPDCADVVIARELSRRASLPHVHRTIDGRYLLESLDHGVYVSGGMMSCVHYHILRLARDLAADGGVVLDGLGGDALTGGHLEWRMLLARDPRAAVRATHRMRATACTARADLEALLDPFFLEQASAYDPVQAIRAHFEPHGPGRPWEGAHRFDLLERQRRFIQMGAHLLRPFADVRAPFYGRGVWSLLRTLPARYLAEQRVYLRMHREHFPALAAVPDARRGLPLSRSAPSRFAKRALDFARRRVPLLPPGTPWDGASQPTSYRQWWRNELRDLLHDTLLSSRPRYQAVIRRDTVADLVRAHDAGGADHTAVLGCLVTFETFLRSVEQASASVPLPGTAREAR